MKALRVVRIGDNLGMVSVPPLQIGDNIHKFHLDATSHLPLATNWGPFILLTTAVRVGGLSILYTVNSLITANEMQMRTPIFGQIRAQMVVRIDCAHLMRMQKSGCINAAENRTSGTNRYVRTRTVRVYVYCTVYM